MRASGNNIIVPRDFNRLAGAFALSVLASQARLQAPSIDSGRFYRIAPVNLGAEPVFPLAWVNRFYSPIELTETETLTAQILDTTAGASLSKIFAFFSDGLPETVNGEIFTIRATGTATLVANTWSPVTLTLQDNLIAGRYAVVGAKFESAGCCAARFVPVDIGNYRPGAIGTDSSADANDPIFRNGGLGSWFEFEHDTLPTVEFCSISADTAEVVYLDLIQVRAGSS